MIYKLWTKADKRVEKFMPPIDAALDRASLTGEHRTDIYNRAYEAVQNAIKSMEKENEINYR